MTAPYVAIRSFIASGSLVMSDQLAAFASRFGQSPLSALPFWSPEVYG